MRIDQLLQVTGRFSRNQVKRLLKSQQVVVDGCVLRNPASNVDPGLQEIIVKGRQIHEPKATYYMLNKPKGVVSATVDRKHPTVLDCLDPSDRRPGMYPIGRLDRDTEGLVLLTDNGPLGFRMLHPNHHVEKTYEVEVNGPLEDDAVILFQSGVVFPDGKRCKPALLEIIWSRKDRAKARVTLSEGKFHQVKKMFLTYGVKVEMLKRIRFGEFELDPHLPAGEYRSLTQEEKQYLKAYLGK